MVNKLGQSMTFGVQERGSDPGRREAAIFCPRAAREEYGPGGSMRTKTNLLVGMTAATGAIWLIATAVTSSSAYAATTAALKDSQKGSSAAGFSGGGDCAGYSGTDTLWHFVVPALDASPKSTDPNITSIAASFDGMVTGSEVIQNGKGVNVFTSGATTVNDATATLSGNIPDDDAVLVLSHTCAGTSTGGGGGSTSGGNTTGSGTTGSSTTGSSTTGSSTTGSSTTGSRTTGSSTTGRRTTGSSTTGSRTTGSSTTGSSTRGSSTTGSSTTGSSTTGSSTTGSSTTGSSTTGSSTTGSSRTGNATGGGNGN